MKETAQPRAAFSLLIAAAINLALFGFGLTPALAREAQAPTIQTAQALKVFLPLISVPVGPKNGDFEKGRVSWVESSIHGWKIIFYTSELGIAPHSGSWAAWLGGVLTETSAIQQSTLVSGSYPYLSYWRWIASDETNCGSNLASVTVNDAVVKQYELCAGVNTHGWVNQVLDLRAYAGKTVSLQFTASIGSAKNSNLFIDDIFFQSSASIK
jgi:hypothetical protein